MAQAAEEATNTSSTSGISSDLVLLCRPEAASSSAMCGNPHLQKLPVGLPLEQRQHDDDGQEGKTNTAASRNPGSLSIGPLVSTVRLKGLLGALGEHEIYAVGWGAG